MKTQEILSILLPSGIEQYFELIKVESKTDSYVFYLEERNIKPENYLQSQLESKGFYEPATVQDFPLRGKACFYNIKRRRWLIKTTGEIISRDWNLVAKGTRMTTEFATFLKGINRIYTSKH